MTAFACYRESGRSKPKVKITAPGRWLIRARPAARLPDGVNYNATARLMFNAK